MHSRGACLVRRSSPRETRALRRGPEPISATWSVWRSRACSSSRPDGLYDPAPDLASPARLPERLASLSVGGCGSSRLREGLPTLGSGRPARLPAADGHATCDSLVIARAPPTGWAAASVLRSARSHRHERRAPWMRSPGGRRKRDLGLLRCSPTHEFQATPRPGDVKGKFEFSNERRRSTSSSQGSARSVHPDRRIRDRRREARP